MRDTAGWASQSARGSTSGARRRTGGLASAVSFVKPGEPKARPRGWCPSSPRLGFEPTKRAARGRCSPSPEPAFSHLSIPCGQPPAAALVPLVTTPPLTSCRWLKAVIRPSAHDGDGGTFTCHRPSAPVWLRYSEYRPYTPYRRLQDSDYSDQIQTCIEMYTCDLYRGPLKQAGRQPGIR